MSRTFVIRSAERARDIMRLAYQCATVMAAGGAVEIVVRMFDDNRTDSQNRKLWPMLTDISRQIEWPVNGSMGLLQPEDWKDILSAELTKEQRIAQGVSGGFVLLGLRTSKLKKKQFADLIEIIYAFGAERGVSWSEKANSVYALYREARAA